MQYGSYTHAHVSEREDAHRWPDGRFDDARWEDCLWASAIEVFRFAGGGVPATHAEAEALRADAGEQPTGGSNHDDLARGLQARYGLTSQQGMGITKLRTELMPGAAAAVNGLMGAFPPGHRLRRHDPDFDGGHTVATFNLGDPDGRVWWCDPLGPATGYLGEWVTWREVERFVNGLDGRFTWMRRVEGMWEVEARWEEWKPTVSATGRSNGVLRTAPDIAAPIVVRLPSNKIILTRAEVDTYPLARIRDDDWREVRWLDPATGKYRTLYALRRDWIPLVQGGDDALDLRIEAAIDRRGAANPIELEKARKLGAAAALNDAANAAAPAVTAAIDRVAVQYAGGEGS